MITKAVGHGPTKSNPLLCNACFGQLRKHPGGAEIEISVLFADIRGSTGIAERTSAGSSDDSSRSTISARRRRSIRSDGIIDKFLGDGIMALFIPVMSGPMHARRAVDAGEALLRAVVDPQLVAGGVRVGAGVHTGPAFVGTVGSDEKLDFTALGDTVNVAARLGSDAGAGELLVTATAWQAAGREGDVVRRGNTVKGRAERLEVVVLGAATEVAVA